MEKINKKIVRVITEEDLKQVLDAVDKYWRSNALNNNDKNITVCQLLEKSKDLAMFNVLDLRKIKGDAHE